MPRTMYQLEGRAEGHLQGRSEHRIVVRWCRKFPKIKSVDITQYGSKHSHRILLQA